MVDPSEKLSNNHAHDAQVLLLGEQDASVF